MLKGMSDMFFAVALGLIAAIGWGISGFFDAKSSRSVHPIVASFVVNGLLTVVFVVAYVVFLHEGFTVSQQGVVYASAGGAMIALGALAYFKALAIGPISLASPMSSAYPLVTTLLAVAFFGGSIHLAQGIAIGLIVLGILTVTEFLHVISNHKTISKGPLLGLITATCWGVGYAFVAQAVQQGGWQQATLIELLAMMATFGICIPFLKDRQAFTWTAVYAAVTNKNVIIASMTALVAALCFNIGFVYDATGGAIVATFSAFYPVLTVLLALRHFNESVNRIQLLGASASIVGIILLTVL